VFEDILIDDVNIGDTESLSERELLACIAAFDEESDFDVGAAWATLYERAPDPRFLFLSISETYASVEPQMLVEILGHLESTSPELKPHIADLALLTLQVKAKTLVGAPKGALEGLANAMSGKPEEAFDRLTEFSDAVLEEMDLQTADGGALAFAGMGSPATESGPKILDYTPKASFQVGDRISHSKFGEGEVQSKAGKFIQVDFDGEIRKLICLP
jgi:hypothetical protein